MLVIHSNKKVVYVCNKYFYKYLIEYIDSLKLHIPNSELLVYDSINRIKVNRMIMQNKDNIYIVFRHPLKYINLYNHKNIYFFNTEQLSLPNWLQKVKNISNNTIDYSNSNIKYLNKINGNSYHIPYQINEKEIYNLNKINDVAFIGSMSPKRKEIIDKLKNKGINVTLINGWDVNRDHELMKHKILLNIHRIDSLRIFEEIRCNRCIFNKMIIITEKSDYMEDYMLKDYIIECNHNELVDVVINTLNNYTTIYNKLFSDFDINKIEEKTVESLNSFIQDANKLM